MRRRSRFNRVVTETLELRRLLAAVSWDGGGDGTTWSSANNWSTNAVPGVNDDVTISVAGLPTILLNSTADIKSLSCSEIFHINGGLLKTADGATFSATLNWEAGTIIGNVTSTALSATNLTSGNTKVIAGTFNNNGIITYTGDQFGFNNGTLNNNGTFNANNSGGILQIGVGGNTFKNSGTFNKTGASTVLFGGVAFVNTGAFNLTAGGITFETGGSTSVPLQVPAGTTMTFTGGTFALNANLSLSGAGTINLNNIATLTTTLASTQINNLNFNAGTLAAGTGTITLAGIFDWAGGVMTGNIIFDIGSTSNLTGNDVKLINQNTVINRGTVNYSGSNFGFSNATFNNNASFNAQNASLIYQNGQINNTFHNNGLLNKSGASNLTFDGVSLLSAGTLNLNEGSITTSAAITGGGAVNIVPTTSVLKAPSIDQGFVQLNGGLELTGNNQRSTVTTLQMGPSSYLELANNGMAVNYTGASPLATLIPKLIAGRNGGTWNGVGIRSTAAASNTATAIGFGESSHTGLTTFMGAPIDDTAVLFRHTKLGDANLDHAVNFGDLLIVAQNYNQSNRIWTRGNFNFDGNGDVNFSDLLLIAQQYGTSLPALSAQKSMAMRLFELA